MKNKTEEIRRELLTVCADLHVREAGEGEAPSRTIVGRAILFNVPSRPLWADEDEEAVEVIAPEAITREVLDACDIKMTMFHDRQLILARSKQGGCSFMFSTHYWDEGFVSRSVEIHDGKSFITYTVRQVTGIYDFTLAADPFYEGTSVDTREIREAFKPEATKVDEPKPDVEKIKKQLREMRRAANDKVFV